MTPALLQACTGASDARALLHAPFASAAMAEFGITTDARVAAFLAQCAHESLGLVYMKEVWGPTKQQLRYSPPGDLAAGLGNLLPGDGRRYMGRGPIEVTGLKNYRRYGAKLGVDLVQFPQQAEDPSIGWRLSACFWQDNGLNELADAGDFTTITRRINGGTETLVPRLQRLARATKALAAWHAAQASAQPFVAPVAPPDAPTAALELDPDVDLPPAADSFAAGAAS